ncbi:MAG: glycosyltransferase [Deltaproteobacteria bacterium]|nr:glycosyltransferase [Deltaproteobacteria bacterium]MDL1961782.1 glycosyltransferase [Deltaproteobacteria bacterium]
MKNRKKGYHQVTISRKSIIEWKRNLDTRNSFTYRSCRKLVRTLGLSSWLRRQLNRIIQDHDQVDDVLKLEEILAANNHKPIVVLPPLVDWNIPLFQRPQHIARQLAQEELIYFFCTGNCVYDNIFGFQNVAGSLYLTNRFDLLKELNKKKVFNIYSTDNSLAYDFIEEELKKGNKILYEYIDEIHPLISGKSIPKSTIDRHKKILRNEGCMVIASSDKLYKEVMSYRSKNFALITNGVDYYHFRQKFVENELTEDMLLIKNRNKPVIGYFGALAVWFDYALVQKLAAERPEYEILIIGVNYDGSLDKYNLKKYSNVTILGPVSYQDLPKYASIFDISTIPFLKNKITESTSPIKLFEYMALGKPIVTTNITECRKYKSVLIAVDHQDYIKKIDQALALRTNEEYRTILDREAKENSWKIKAEQIINLIGE